ncbi:MAG: 7-carboxy-7-deazaguanine synthase QueE [Gammaproteobacteria bacterium]|nr:7-carboxy-7-deazaguanine synthase QueE [Gammaproteobacteria bacterium]MCF6229399.1 7-carboxy-7-deazaguanine synthase QueE [Gammaproteobacteria bacterium]
MSSLRMSEIFVSLQGESRSIGFPTAFIRLTGCPLRCHYCDTQYAFQGGEQMALGEVVRRVEAFHVHHVCVTGGEPLAQKGVLALLSQLCDKGYEVSLETSGALDVSDVDSRVIKVMDLKTPASGEMEKNLYENISSLTPQDQVKFVICNREDYLWAKEIVLHHDLPACCEVLFSPSFSQQQPAELAQWIIDDHLPVRFQMQLHKILWGEAEGR